jgi:hypothetical protein
MTRTAAINLVIGAVIGLGLGLFYTWVVSPVQYTDTGPASLRADHKADYVIMIARGYAADSNLEAARAQLAPLALEDPATYVADLTAAQIQRGAPPDDLRALSALALGLGGVPPPLP